MPNLRFLRSLAWTHLLIMICKIPQWGIKMIKFIPHWGNFSKEFIPHWGIICIFAAVLNDIHLKEQDMIDGAWNHHPSLVLRNELLESWAFACGLSTGWRSKSSFQGVWGHDALLMPGACGDTMVFWYLKRVELTCETWVFWIAQILNDFQR